MTHQQQQGNKNSDPTYHVLYPFQLATSQGGLYSAAQVTASAPIPAPFSKLVFHSPDTAPFKLGQSDVSPVTDNGKSLPFDPWFRHDFLFQHLQSYTEMIPAWIAKEMYRDTTIANPGSLEYLREFFQKHPIDLTLDDEHSARFDSALNAFKPGDAIGVQGPVWFIPFLLKNGATIREKGVKHVQFEHQLIPENLDKTPLGERMLPCYQQADVIFFHTSVYADRLANMLKGKLPEMRTVDLGIDRAWLDSAQQRVSEPSHMTGWSELTARQQELINAVCQARTTIPHRFFCFDRMDPMKGTHTIILGIKLFLDEARQQEGENYKNRYQFASVHELINIDKYKEFSPKDQYLRLCKQLYADLQKDHPGVVFVSESFTSAHGHREILPSLMRGRTTLALHGQDGLGLSALEAAYVNRNEDAGLIVGDQAGCYLEANKRGLGKLVHGVEAGNPVAVKEAIWEVVRLRDRAPGALAERNAEFSRSFVERRNGTMGLL